MCPPLYEEQPDGGYLLRDSDDALPEKDENSDLNLTRAGWASLSILSWNLLSSTPMPDLSELNAEVEK